MLTYTLQREPSFRVHSDTTHSEYYAYSFYNSGAKTLPLPSDWFNVRTERKIVTRPDNIYGIHICVYVCNNKIKYYFVRLHY